MTNRIRFRYSKLSIGLALALAAAPAFAQNTTSAVAGRITSADGQPVSGAQVSIMHTESGSVSNVVTDSEGRYASRGLRTGGPYTITITKDGVTEKREGVYLQLAESTSVDARLGQVATTIAAIEVTGANVGSEIFSSTRMGAGTSISREQLTSFASVQRNLQDYARLDPRLSQTDKERGEISVGGQNSRFNTVTIDAMATNDTFGLEANNLPTLKQPISIDAIQSVQINVSNYDVTQKGYTGANINAVTKSGTNDWHGSLYYVYRNDSVAGDRYNRTSDSYTAPPSFSEKTPGFTFGGPIIQDRLFFFASYEELTSTRSTPEFGPLGSNSTNVAITPSSIAGAQSISTGTYQFDAGEVTAAAAELFVKDALIKLDANITDQHRASLRWSRTEQSDPIFPDFFNNALSLSSHWYSQDKTIETWVGQVFSDWTDNFSTELKVSFRDYKSEPINASNLPQVRLNFAGALPAGSPTVSSTSAGLLFGTERSRHFNDLATETWNYYLGGNLFLGDHELKFGADYDDNEVYNAFLQDTRGNYTFACINSSAAVPYTDPLLAGTTLVCSSATRAQNEAAVLENYRRGRPTAYQVQIGNAPNSLDDGVAVWDIQNLGLFLQDTWAVNSNLTITAGLRYDQKSMGVDPLFNSVAAGAPINGSILLVNTPTGSSPATVSNAGVAVRATGGFGLRNDHTLDGSSIFQPRFGFNYTFDSERPMQLRGGFGLFEGSAANVWLSNPYSNTGIATRIVGCGGSFAACPTTGGLFNPDPNSQQTTFAGAAPAANVDFLSTDLEQPSVWKANLAFEHELPFWGINMSLEYLHTEVQDAIYYKHLNLGAPSRIGPDGRDMFYTLAGYNTLCWQNSGASINNVSPCNSSVTGSAGSPPITTVRDALRTRALSNASFANVLVAERTGKGGGDNFAATFTGRFFEEWNWSLGYSYTTAKEVSSLSSSVANSSWQSVSVFNANEEVLANSAYLVKERFTGSLNWKHNFWGNYATRLGIFYEGRKGKPYSWIYNNDLNGDGATNDLMYIPNAPGSGEVTFRDVGGAVGSADEEATFWAIVQAQGIEDYAGRVVPRNSSYAKWTNTFDVRLSQELPGFFEGNKVTLTLDVLNIGNLFNKDWGHIDEIGFQSAGGLARSFVNYLGIDGGGRYIYGVNTTVEDFVTRQVRGESQWTGQVTLKYEF